LAVKPRPSQWIELEVTAATEAVDAIAEVFRSHGISGVAVEPSVVPADDEGIQYAGDSARILAYIPFDDDAARRQTQLEQVLWHLRAFDLAPISALSTRVIAEEDWANSWKEHFHPLRIGRRFVIKPSWREFDAQPDELIIALDPGMAFGTGLHPTTRMMLEAMEDVIVTGDRVFDVGTGSGILAIAAARLGAAEVLAVDVDPIACSIASENIGLNKVDSVVSVSEGSGGSEGTFDVVLANIIATVIADLAPTIRGLMKADSRLIVSGIIEERAHLVSEAFAEAGLEIITTWRDRDWLCQLVAAG
jgi:ribosomal protein L11 methyltransferase